MDMFFKERKKKPVVEGSHVGFFATKDGGLAVDRAALHRSDNFKRQVDALVEISKRLKQAG